MSDVTIVTATTGSEFLEQNILSVANQTYKNFQHLVVVDGAHHFDKVEKVLERIPNLDIDLIVLPYPTGIEQYNGHKIYGASTYLAKGNYITFLDEDNWVEPNHIESLMDVVKDDEWACALRKIVDHDGTYICNDDCESLGNWESVINDYFVDVNCFFLPRQLALQLSPLWHRRARHPEDQPEVDRALTYTLKGNNINCNVSGKYTVNYRAGNRMDSVQKEFFLKGNEVMKNKYQGGFPWRK
jgi:glycosyltransferase involved in cell wall biosynthesis